jgi:hypothetical protein
MKLMFTFFLLSMVLFYSNYYCCTTAIVSGKHTKDGRPLLVKHRDTSFDQNKLMYFMDGKYDYIGLVNSIDKEGNEVWGGSNSVGFAIMNSASYNLKPHDDTTKYMDKEGIVMKLALQQCATLEDFEQLLNELPKPLGVEANFGVIDANGGCAYYECDNFKFTKIDANDPNIAPFGYVIRTNYSFNGDQDEGYGYIRYLTAEKLFYNAAASKNLDYKFILQKMSRNLDHSLTGVNLENELVPAAQSKFVTMQDYIVRSTSVSTILVKGVKKGENPSLTTIWTILGFPLTSVSIPTWVAAGENLPNIVLADNSGNAPLCDASLKLKKKCFPIERGSGNKYMNLTEVMNLDGTGIYQQIIPFENEIFSQTNLFLMNWRQKNKIAKQEAMDLYKRLNSTVTHFYNQLLEIR